MCGRRQVSYRLFVRVAIALAWAVCVLWVPVSASAQGPMVGELAGDRQPNGSHEVRARPSASQRSSGHQLPVPGAVVRRFVPPATPFAPGHRGVGLSAAPGTAVAASAAGTVHHAGPVAGTTWVSIRHADGVITSYGPLANVQVIRGQHVDAGTWLGTVDVATHDPHRVTGLLHWGARYDGAYIDPLRLVDAMTARPSLVGPGGWRGSDHAVEPYVAWDGAAGARVFAAPSPVAHRPGYSYAPSPNHLVLISGLATASADEPFDPHHLGYTPDSVTVLSYAGRRQGADPASLDAADTRRDQLPYGPEHTWTGFAVAAQRLEDQLRAFAAREPGRAVDLVGHSQGGMVALHYLAFHHDAYDIGLPPIGSVVTIASPHQGADVADMARWIRGNRPTADLLHLLLTRLHFGHDTPQLSRTPLDMPALDQLATGSGALEELADGWSSALVDGGAGPLATGTRLLTIGGSRDLVASPGSTSHPARPGALADADMRGEVDMPIHVVLPGGHEHVKRTEALRQVVWRFLSHEPVEAPSATLTSEMADGAGLLLRLTGRAAAVGGGPGTTHPPLG